MAKQGSYLTLVSDNSAPKADAAQSGERNSEFNIVALGQLEAREQREVRELVQSIQSGAAILGVQIGPHARDLRPIVVIAKENGPTIIRRVPAEAGTAAVHVRELLERIAESPQLRESTLLVDWGFIGESLFYRRKVVDNTLSTLLQKREALSFTESLTIAQRLIEAAEDLHEAGVVHGHITAENIGLSTDSSLRLIDPGIGVGLFRGSLEQGSSGGADELSFAPEIRDSGAVVRSSDVYAIGTVFRKLFELLHPEEQKVRGPQKRPQSFVTLADLIEAMTDPNPARRPLLTDVKSFLGQAAAKSDNSELRAHGQPLRSGRAAAALSRGKMVRITKPSGADEGRELSPERQVERAARARGIKFDLSAIEAASESAPGSLKEEVSRSAAASEKGPASAPAEADTSHQLHRSLDSQPALQTSAAPSAPQASVQNFFTHAAGPIPPHVFHAHQQLPPQYYYGQYQAPVNPYAPPTAPYFPPPLPGAGAPAAADAHKFAPHAGGNAAADAPRPQKSSGSVFWASLLTLIVLCCGVYYKQSQAQTAYSSEELELAWFSKRPSLMIPVAQMALDTDQPDEFAEMLVVSSILNGQANVAGINRELLRIAFDSRWEQQLSAADRRVALALSLTGLLQDRTPTDLQAIESTHPGVVLAIAATGGDRVGSFLNRVPAAQLTQLPRPLGDAFAKVISGREDVHCGDAAVLGLARFAGRGWTSTEEIFAYLEQDTAVRLQAMTELARTDAEKSAELLTLVLEHPNFNLNSELADWGRTWKLGQWNELSGYSKLQLLSGVIPAQAVRPENVAKLFAHPTPSVRGAAMKQAIDSIAFGHPAAAEVLAHLSANPQELGPRQTLVLARLLESPKKVAAEEVRSWLNEEPPLELAALLLTGDASAKEASQLDFELARYLKDHNWAPGPEALAVLVRHPEKLVRMYAYTQAFGLKDKDAAIGLLASARKSEKDPVFRHQLEVMIRNISR